MANSATDKGLVDIRYGRADQGGAIRVYQVAIDTVATDLTVHTPNTDQYVAVAGVVYAESAAHNISFKSATGGDISLTLEIPANSGLYHPVGQGVMFATQASDALVVQSSVAISSMLLYVMEYTDLQLGRS